VRCLTYSEVKGRIAAIFDQPELSRQSEMSTRGPPSVKTGKARGVLSERTAR